MRECREEPSQRFSQKSAGSHSSSSLSEIITALPIQPLSLSMFSSLYYTVFYFLVLPFTSLPLLCNGSSITLFLFVLAHLAVILLACNSLSLPTPPLLLLFSSSFILPSYPLAPWVGAMQVAGAKDTCGTG